MNDSFLDENLRQIRDSVLKLCAGFGDAYWLEHDRTAEFPETFYRAIADAGWLGIAMPEQYGGAGLGSVEAAVLMQAIAESGAAMSGASAVHMNIFGLQPVVVFGSDEQKQRMLPPLLQGREKACFAVTEPDAGPYNNWLHREPFYCRTGFRRGGQRLCRADTVRHPVWFARLSPARLCPVAREPAASLATAVRSGYRTDKARHSRDFGEVSVEPP